MNKITLFFFLFLFSATININLFAQNSDFGQDSKSGVTANSGITQEESNWLASKTVTPDIEIPQELLNQLEQARLNNDVDEANRINQIINSQYRSGVKIINSESNQNSIPLPEPIIGELFPTEYDWLPGDVLVASDTGGGFQFPRTLDVKLGDDGNLYLASIINTTTQRRINVYKSTNGGATWANKGGVYYPSLSAHFETLSMLVEGKSPGIDDSIRVIIYYTLAANDNNDGASLAYFQFKPNATNQEYILKSIETPTTGREFNYVSAVSDGQYYGSLTYFGCVVGEYSNNADTSISYRVFRTTNCGDTHSSVTLDIYAATWNDYYPVAQFKASSSGSDSVYIVSERVFPSTTQSQVRITIAPWTLSTTFKTNFLTNVSGTYYKKPVIAIKQSPRSIDKRMVITCTKDGEAKYHYSLNSGDSWSTDLLLDNRATPSVNTNYTYVTSDSTGSSEDFCAMFSERTNGTTNDSINVRRGAPGIGLGTTLYKQNSERITSTHPAVTTIYRDGGNLKTAFAYWANGPRGIYFDAEHLVTNVTSLPGAVDKYELAQNFPNPFNPNTIIRFSVPEQANVTLKIFNSIGQEVATLLNGEIAAGNHQVDFNASALSSGVYFYRISSSNFTATKKMILIK
jgi:hypothetical protein